MTRCWWCWVLVAVAGIALTVLAIGQEPVNRGDCIPGGWELPEDAGVERCPR